MSPAPDDRPPAPNRESAAALRIGARSRRWGLVVAVVAVALVLGAVLASVVLSGDGEGSPGPWVPTLSGTPDGSGERPSTPSPTRLPPPTNSAAPTTQTTTLGPTLGPTSGPTSGPPSGPTQPVGSPPTPRPTRLPPPVNPSAP